MKIRKIQKSDVEVCAKILERAYARAPYNEKFNDPQFAIHYIQGKYDGCFENSFVYENDSMEVVAFVFIGVSFWSNGLQAILEEIVVDPEYQGIGVGAQFMGHINKHLESLDVKSVMLWTNTNERLIDFYKKHDYFVADDFVVMFKNIE